MMFVDDMFCCTPLAPLALAMIHFETVLSGSVELCTSANTKIYWKSELLTKIKHSRNKSKIIVCIIRNPLKNCGSPKIKVAYMSRKDGRWLIVKYKSSYSFSWSYDGDFLGIFPT